MTRSKITLLCCLPALAAASATLAESAETLVVGAGETLELVSPEAGAGLEAALDGGPLVPSGPTLAAPVAGDHWLALASRDAAGNLSEVRWLRLRVDAEPPRVSLEPMPAAAGGARRWMPPGSEVTAQAEDDLAGVAGLFLAVGDEAREVVAESVSAALPAAGEVTVRAWALDLAGNRSAEATLELAIDSTPPAAEVRAGCVPAPGAADTVVAPDCPIDVEVHDGQSGGAVWSLTLDGEPAVAAALAGPWTAGPHTVEVTAADAVGNASRILFPFIADGAGPKISWRVASPGVTGAGGDTFYRPPVEVVATAADAPAGLGQLAAAANGGGLRPIDGTVEVDGDRLLLRAVDGVGNVSETQASWRLDVTPPEIRLETSDGAAIPAGAGLELEPGAEIRFRITDRDAGVERSTYSIAVLSARPFRRWWWRPPTGEALPERLAFRWPGRLQLTVDAVDRLGNRGAAQWQVVVRPKRSPRAAAGKQGGAGS